MTFNGKIANIVTYRGNVTFNASGLVDIQITGARDGDPVIACRGTGSPSSVELSAKVSANDTVTIGIVL